jgi:hypothetical protein
MKVNYILKVEDAKPVAIQKALKEAGITVASIQQVYKEQEPGEENEPAKEPAEE